ncbi:hypothetical protein FA15DRAFT_717318 [Coprinopsis marcescibilis]|uniref:Uncharacterized protein n=1 Tax=Coprinopsis marcescibilis TaxID=230819 RepID=A0A5C3KM12_COPMA|nr:hypothetical protein FA15DRAFT_717318 [Coprinopsis marcescibilis]
MGIWAVLRIPINDSVPLLLRLFSAFSAPVSGPLVNEPVNGSARNGGTASLREGGNEAEVVTNPAPAIANKTTTSAVPPSSTLKRVSEEAATPPVFSTSTTTATVSVLPPVTTNDAAETAVTMTTAPSTAPAAISLLTPQPQAGDSTPKFAPSPAPPALSPAARNPEARRSSSIFGRWFGRGRSTSVSASPVSSLEPSAVAPVVTQEVIVEQSPADSDPTWWCTPPSVVVVDPKVPTTQVEVHEVTEVAVDGKVVELKENQRVEDTPEMLAVVTEQSVTMPVPIMDAQPEPQQHKPVPQGSPDTHPVCSDALDTTPTRTTEEPWRDYNQTSHAQMPGPARAPVPTASAEVPTAALTAAPPAATQTRRLLSSHFVCSRRPLNTHWDWLLRSWNRLRCTTDRCRSTIDTKAPGTTAG